MTSIKLCKSLIWVEINIPKSKGQVSLRIYKALELMHLINTGRLKTGESEFIHSMLS